MATKKTGTKSSGSKTTSSTARKTSTTPKPSTAKPAEAVAATASAPAETGGDQAKANTVGKKEMFERVKARAEGVQGRQVRQVMNLVLDELGAALVSGQTVRVPALGVLRVRRHVDSDDVDVVVCKLRRKKRDDGPKDPLAEAAE